jgi:predicted acetyltransferase
VTRATRDRIEQRSAVNLDVRLCRDDEFRRFLETCEAAFGFDVKDEDVERFRRVISPERMHAAFDDDTMVGTTGSFPFTVTIPGGELPAGGITMVGVLPSHRRRGVLTRMMRAQLDHTHHSEEPIAVLWASEGAIYGRYGYGAATRQAEIDIERERAVFPHDPPGQGRCRLLTTDEAMKVLPDVYERARRTTPGMFARSHEWWQNHRLADPEKWRDGGGPMWRVVWENAGGAEAYALYRVHNVWKEGMPAGWTHVLEAIATSPRATREIWRFLFGVDLVARVKSWFLPPDHALFHMVSEPRRLRMTVKDALWLRIVDVRGALEPRSYAREGVITVELSDPLCSWNEGTWRIEAEHEGARVSATTDEPDLTLGAADLGAVYLGGTTFSELVDAGRVTEHRPAAALEATMMFMTERAPWCPEIF